MEITTSTTSHDLFAGQYLDIIGEKLLVNHFWELKG